MFEFSRWVIYRITIWPIYRVCRFLIQKIKTQTEAVRMHIFLAGSHTYTFVRVLKKKTSAQETRMHSSRMHTGHALTVSGGGLVHPRRIFFRKRNWKKKKKKIWRPPKKLETPPKFGDTTPPKKKFGDPPEIWRNPPRPDHPPCGQTHACKNITLAQLRCGR